MENKMINRDDAIKKIWKLAGDIKTSLALNNGSLNREELLSMGYSTEGIKVVKTFETHKKIINFTDIYLLNGNPKSIYEVLHIQ